VGKHRLTTIKIAAIRLAI